MNTPAPDRAAQGPRRRAQLIGLTLLFLAPLGLAFISYYGHVGWRPTNRVNHGHLIDPPQPVPALVLPLASSGDAAAQDTPPRATRPDFLMRKWTLLYWGAGSCGERCRRNLYDTRQVRIALNRDMRRVQRVFVAEGDCCDFDYLRTEQPDLITVRATPAAQPLRALLPAAGDAGSLATAATGAAGAAGAAGADRVYLIDPLGNLMMWYAPDADPKGMLEDLKRLLGLSQVG